MNVLVAGGAGYIGSHTVKRLKEAGHTPVIYDNFSRGHQAVIKILDVAAEVGDLNDRPKFTAALRHHKIDTVMHFAAYAYVGESVEKPLMYYQNNVATTISVLESMQDAGVNSFVFSSTAVSSRAFGGAVRATVWLTSCPWITPITVPLTCRAASRWRLLARSRLPVLLRLSAIERCTPGGTVAAISKIASSDMTPGPLGIAETRPSALAPARTASRASATLATQQILTLGVVVASMRPPFWIQWSIGV